MSNFVLTVKELSKSFSNQVGFFKTETFFAVNSVSFSLKQGETLAIIGDDGAGKSTIAKMIAGMIEPSSGEIFAGQHQLHFGDQNFRSKIIRFIPQNPENSFNPKHTVKDLLSIPLKINTSLSEEECEERMIETLKQIGLQPNHMRSYPAQMATGQKQRIALAKALILKPKIIIADEPLATLSTSLQAQIINLLLTLQADHQLSYIYITKDLGIAKHISDKLLVMQQNGKVAEYGNTAEVLASPLSETTKKLIENYFGETLSADLWSQNV